MEKLLKGLSVSVRQVFSAVAPLVVVVLLFIFIGNFGVSKVLALRDQIKSAQIDETALTQKLKLLQGISPAEAAEASAATSALPDVSPSLAVISQLKILASENGILLSTIKTGSAGAGTSSLSEVDISFTAKGSRPQIFSFLEGISQIAPITIVGTVKMSETSDLVSSDIKTKSFWADFPKTIPTVTQSVTDLTAAEKDILTKISGLTQPIFLQLTPIQGSTNPNPFGQ